MSKTRKKYQEKRNVAIQIHQMAWLSLPQKTGRSLSASLAWQDWH